MQNAVRKFVVAAHRRRGPVLVVAAATIGAVGLACGGPLAVPAAPAGRPAAARPTRAAAGARPVLTDATRSDTDAGTSSSSGNLLEGDQAEFTSSTGGWSAAQGTVAWTGAVGYDQPGALQLTATGTGGASAWSGSPPEGATVGQAGEVYQGSAEVMSPVAGVGVSAAVAFYSSDGTVLNAAFGQEETLTAFSWSMPPTAVGLAPAGTAYVTVGLDMWISTPGQTLYVDAAQLTATPDQTPAVVGPLSTSGNQVLDGDGQPLVLQGIDLSGLESSTDPPAATLANIEEIKAWGANMVRIDLGEQFWLADSCAYDPGYASTVAQVVDWVTSLGMVALLDLHWNNPADLDDTGGSCPAAGQQVMADDPGSLEFWSEVAATFADNPLVAFDLYNEPYGISDQVWLDGGTVGSGTGAYQAAGMQQMYDTVAAAAPGHLVVVSGQDWANDPPPSLVQTLPGTDVVYSVHAYTCPQSTSDCTSSDPLDPSSILDAWVSFGQQQPVIVGEFGYPDQTVGTYLQNVIDFARAQRWGWDAYAWDGTNGGAFDLVANAPGSGTVEPAPSGMPVLAADAGATPLTPPALPSGSSPVQPPTGTPSPASAPTPDPSTAPPASDGYWEVASDGGLFAFGDAAFYGSMGGQHLDAPIVGLAATPDGGGYWEVASDGGLFAFGDATFYGSMGGQHLDAPIVGLAATPDGGGYWEVASDGGLFAFGDATFYGSMGGQHLDAPIVGLAALG